MGLLMHRGLLRILLFLLLPNAGRVSCSGKRTSAEGMRVWGKKTEPEASGASVARAALGGASRKELVREALCALTQAPQADRVGIWLEPDANPSSENEFSGAFHGLVWDRAVGEECPPQWRILSVEAPLPEQLLVGT